MPGLVPLNPKYKGFDFIDWAAEFRDGQDVETIVAELHALKDAAKPLKGNGRPEPEAYDERPHRVVVPPARTRRR